MLHAPAQADPLIDRINNRDFPSVFQAWNKADNVPDESDITTLARHDLVWHGCSWYGLRWNSTYEGDAESFTKESIDTALAFRRGIEALNPNMIFIAEIRYRDAWDGFLPEDSEYWMRDSDGNRVPGWGEGGYYLMNYPDPAFQLHVANRARAAIDSGVVDGILLDWWWPEDAHRLALIQTVRKTIGHDPVIIVNTNINMPVETAPYINGLFMEVTNTDSPSSWEQVANALVWAEHNLTPPRVNCLETWYHNSRDDLNLMRATTALSLGLSDGYCLFSDPNWLPTQDHLHNWYSFWDKEVRPGQKKLGKSLGPGIVRPDKAVSRDFEHGTVVYNPAGNECVTVTFSTPHESVATGKMGTEHLLDAEDGDIYVGSGGSE